MSIGKKIIFAYGVAVLFTILLSALSIVRSRALNESARLLAARSLPGIDAAGRLAGIAKDIRGGIRGHITAADPAAKTKAEQDLAQLRHSTETELRKYDDRLRELEERYKGSV
jgi:CHASE3 domain sensor protein